MTTAALLASNPHAAALSAAIDRRTATVAVIGLGYVGLPLAAAFHSAGFKVLGYDIDRDLIARLNARGPLDPVRAQIALERPAVAAMLAARERFSASATPTDLARADAVILCVPTPLDAHRQPDLTAIQRSTEAVASSTRPGQIIVLESTSYPGTTEELCQPILEKAGAKIGIDRFLGFSPEREDPGRKTHDTKTIPKVTSGVTPVCAALIDKLYAAAVAQTVPAASVRVAESAKLLENIFRCVNIALVNELKIVFEKMGIDVWEVIRAASTKPFGFMPFYPGPGLGGHCIPIDPFYLTWKAKEFGINTRFIELAGEINTAMPEYVMGRVRLACDRIGKPLKGTGVLVLGIAYKKNIGDQRESPSLEILEQLRAAGARIAFSDPFCATCEGHRHHPHLKLASQPLSAALFKEHPVVVLATDHDAFDYRAIHEWVRAANGVIVDTRHAFASHGIVSDRVVDA